MLRMDGGIFFSVKFLRRRDFCRGRNKLLREMVSAARESSAAPRVAAFVQRESRGCFGMQGNL